MNHSVFENTNHDSPSNLRDLDATEELKRPLRSQREHTSQDYQENYQTLKHPSEIAYSDFAYTMASKKLESSQITNRNNNDL